MYMSMVKLRVLIALKIKQNNKEARLRLCESELHGWIDKVYDAGKENR